MASNKQTSAHQGPSDVATDIPAAIGNQPMLEDEDDRDGTKDRNFVVALARGMELLRCFSRQESVLGNQELAAKTGLPKATVSRMTYTLAQLGYLKKHPFSGRYQLDVGVLAFGYQMLSNLPIRSIANSFMVELAQHAHAAVALAARDRLQMVYIDVVHGQTNLTTRRQVGYHMPIHLTSIGRACMAAMPDAQRDGLLDQLRSRNEGDWLEIRRGLERAFRDYADFGYCLSIGEWERDVNSVGVPFVHPEYGILAFNCGGPSFVLPREKLEDDIGPRLKHMVSQMRAVAL
ncbi:IclR family transcriptional regulator [Sphingomonas sp. BK069]|uniref:IclR family transcriptional regulator n=1 Tax=Sphingomonas sp. BK069 TaxID=2586979 RepID=UPI0017EB988B|nr:IclR family transcriptional regulator [Sphingomonas sp. BK069]MBB3349485.1 DNA-binding IclR family transcriptional regulator [Sphingomonas sp. BK069]